MIINVINHATINRENMKLMSNKGIITKRYINNKQTVRCMKRMKVPFGLRPGCVAAREDASGTKEQKH